MEIQAKMKRHRFEKGDVKRKKKKCFYACEEKLV